jgi:hypothetical protein
MCPFALPQSEQSEEEGGLFAYTKKGLQQFTLQSRKLQIIQGLKKKRAQLEAICWAHLG